MRSWICKTDSRPDHFSPIVTNKPTPLTLRDPISLRPFPTSCQGSLWRSTHLQRLIQIPSRVGSLRFASSSFRSPFRIVLATLNRSSRANSSWTLHRDSTFGSSFFRSSCSGLQLIAPSDVSSPYRLLAGDSGFRDDPSPRIGLWNLESEELVVSDLGEDVPFTLYHLLSIPSWGPTPGSCLLASGGQYSYRAPRILSRLLQIDLERHSVYSEFRDIESRPLDFVREVDVAPDRGLIVGACSPKPYSLRIWDRRIGNEAVFRSSCLAEGSSVCFVDRCHAVVVGLSNGSVVAYDIRNFSRIRYVVRTLSGMRVSELIPSPENSSASSSCVIASSTGLISRINVQTAKIETSIRLRTNSTELCAVREGEGVWEWKRLELFEDEELWERVLFAIRRQYGVWINIELLEDWLIPVSVL